MFKSLQKLHRVVWPKAKAIVDRNPLVSNAVIYGTLYTLAEVSQQTVQHMVKDTTTSCTLARDTTSLTSRLDLSSVKRYAIMGTVCISPMLTKWYSWIDNKFPSKARAVVLKKVILDQFVFTPFVVIVFFVGMSYLEGKKGPKLFDELREKGLKTFAMDCCFWIPATVRKSYWFAWIFENMFIFQTINFIFVPPWLRVTFIGVASFLWLNVLCWIKSWPINDSQASQDPNGHKCTLSS